MQQFLCQISVNSKIDKPYLQKNKQISANNYDSKLSQPHFSQLIMLRKEHQTRNSPPNKRVERKIQQIEVAQKQLTIKYQKVINNLILEISKADQTNELLEREVTQLTEQLEESKKDLNIIVNYLNKKKQKDSSNTGIKTILNSTKVSEKIDKSISGSKKKKETNYNLGQKDLQNKLVHQLLIKQTVK